MLGLEPNSVLYESTVSPPTLHRHRSLIQELNLSPQLTKLVHLRNASEAGGSKELRYPTPTSTEWCASFTLWSLVGAGRVELPGPKATGLQSAYRPPA